MPNTHAPSPRPPVAAGAEGTTWVPRCVQRKGTPCRDCVECLSTLPNGLTCETGCVHVRKCQAMFGQKGDEHYCQWVPSRFTPTREVSRA